MDNFQTFLDDRKDILPEGYFESSCIYNYDEMGSDPYMSRSKILGFCSVDRSFLITTGDKFPFHVTIGVISCADGTLMSPLVIHSSPNTKDPRIKKSHLKHLD